jgi:hypothetical protein
MNLPTCKPLGATVSPRNNDPEPVGTPRSDKTNYGPGHKF